MLLLRKSSISKIFSFFSYWQKYITYSIIHLGIACLDTNLYRSYKRKSFQKNEILNICILWLRWKNNKIIICLLVEAKNVLNYLKWWKKKQIKIKIIYLDLFLLYFWPIPNSSRRRRRRKFVFVANIFLTMFKVLQKMY